MSGAVAATVEGRAVDVRPVFAEAEAARPFAFDDGGEPILVDLSQPRPAVRSGPLDALSFLASKGGLRDDEGHDLLGGRNAQRFLPG